MIGLYTPPPFKKGERDLKELLIWSSKPRLTFRKIKRKPRFDCYSVRSLYPVSLVFWPDSHIGVGADKATQGPLLFQLPDSVIRGDPTP
jgi:hypothetical protein